MQRVPTARHPAKIGTSCRKRPKIRVYGFAKRSSSILSESADSFSRRFLMVQKLRRHSKSDRLLERMPKEISNWLAKSAADTAVRPAGCVSKLRDGTPRKYTCDAYGPLRLENACAFSCGAYSAEISSVFPRTSRYVRLRIFLVSGSSVSTRICLSIHWPPIF
jgi:hypothetical protein